MTSRPDPPASSPSGDARDGQAALRARAREALTHQPSPTVTVLSSLLAAQDELGYLPMEAIEEVAHRTSASPNEVWGVASFYPNFRFTPPGRHKVELCWGPTCDVLGAQEILQGLLPHLGLEAEGDTDDGAITLKLNTCLGVCPHAPAMSFDERLAGHMDPQRAIRLVERLRVEDQEQQRAMALDRESALARADREARAVARAAERAERERVETVAWAEAQAEAVATVEAEAPLAEPEPSAAQVATEGELPAGQASVAASGGADAGAPGDAKPEAQEQPAPPFDEAQPAERAAVVESEEDAVAVADAPPRSAVATEKATQPEGKPKAKAKPKPKAKPKAKAKAKPKAKARPRTARKTKG